MAQLSLTLRYEGRDADESVLDFYDAAIALVGFQRSLAITTHLVLNDQVITQAPALKGAQIFAIPPEEGSWKLTAVVALAASATFHLGTAPKDTPIGHLVSSAYDYVVARTLGFHVDYNKTLGVQYEDALKAGTVAKAIPPERFESAIEKSEKAIRDMHRPMVASQTASEATIVGHMQGGTMPIGAPLNRFTFDQMMLMKLDEPVQPFAGRVSMYNVNTFKGRVFLPNEMRPIPFQIAEMGRSPRTISAIAYSLAHNADLSQSRGEITFMAAPLRARTGRLTGLLIFDVAP